MTRGGGFPLRWRGGEGLERRLHRIDESAEEAGGGGFTGAGGSAEDEDGIGAGGAQGGGEPSKDARPRSSFGDVEEGAQAVERLRVRGGFGSGERAGSGSALKGVVEAIGRLPAVLRNLDALGLRVGEIEDDGVVGAGDDASSGGRAGGRSELHFGVEGLEHGIDGVGGGRDSGFGAEGVDHPAAQVRGVERVGVLRERAVRDGGDVVTVGGSAQAANGGDLRQDVGLLAALEMRSCVHL